MRAAAKALLLIAASALAALFVAENAVAQRNFSRAPDAMRGGNDGPRGPMRPGWHGPGVVAVGPVRGIPRDALVDDSATIAPRQQRSANRRPSHAPPASERRLVPDEVVIETASGFSQRQIEALQRRHRLARIESQPFALTGTTLYRWRIPDRRSVASVVRTLERDPTVRSAQPNYIFELQEDAGALTADYSAQYALAKLHLPQAHALSKGDGIRVAVIDSGVDRDNAEIAGSIV